MARALNGFIGQVLAALGAIGIIAASTASAAQDTQAAPVGPPPLAAFAALPNVSQVAVSPDGTGLAWVVPDRNGSKTVIYSNRATRTHRTIDVGFEPTSLLFEDGGALLIGIRSMFIEPNRNIVVYLGRVVVFHPDTGQTFVLEPTQNRNVLPIHVSHGIESLIPELPNKVALMGASPRTLWGETVLAYYYLMDLRTGRVTVEAGGTDETVDWLGGADGQPLARLDFDAAARRGALLVRLPGSRRWETALSFEDVAVPPFRLVARTADSQIILAFPDTENGRFRVMNPRTKTVEDLVIGSDVQLGGLILDPNTSELLGVRLQGLLPRTQWLDPAMQTLQAELEGLHPGQTVEIGSMSRDRSVIAYAVSTRVTPETWFLKDRSAAEPVRIGRAYPTLTTDRGITLEATQFAARDGLEIPVYVTYPAGWDRSKPGPTVIMPHGGPQARDYPGFDWWVHFLVSRGYAVVQPQFRGSSGFGRSFALAGFREWGGKMQDDVTDTVHWAVSRGLAAPDRVCIVGASYGGYAALAGATLTPDLYACAVSVAGISDLRALLRSDRRAAGGDDTISTNYWAEHIGTIGDRALDAVSPAKLVDRIRAPVLLLHGDLDSVVPIDQSRLMAQAMAEAGRDVRLVELPGTDHWLSNAWAREQILREIEVFLARHLGTAEAARGDAAPTRSDAR